MAPDGLTTSVAWRVLLLVLALGVSFRTGWLLVDATIALTRRFLRPYVTARRLAALRRDVAGRYPTLRFGQPED